MSEATHPILSCTMSKSLPSVSNSQNEQNIENEQRPQQQLNETAGNAQQSTHNSQPSLQASESVQEPESFDMKYGAEHVIKLFIPVSLCMLVVVTTINTVTFYTTKDIYLLYTPFHETSSDTFTKTWNAVANSLILIALVITMTVLLIILYKARCYKVIHGWLIFSTLMLMFLFAFLFFEEVLRTYNMPMDIFTVLLFNWNFGVAGMVCIHWKGPLRIQQGYLIFVAALMALVFIKYLPEWTTWMMLFVISIWDIVAVLSPRGPLKILVETAQERNETIFPSLIYSATAYIANISNIDDNDGNASTSTTEFSQQGIVSQESETEMPSETSLVENLLSISKGNKNTSLVQSPDGTKLPNKSQPRLRCVPQSETITNAPLPPYDISGKNIVNIDENVVFKTPGANEDVHNSRSPIANEVGTYALYCPNCQQLVPELSPESLCYQCQQLVLQGQHQMNEEDRGVKLGLGDFIFYSVLVGKVSSYGDWNITVACFIAILVGLCVTLMLLVVFKKALPALPISITVGLIFYFTTTGIVKPFTDMLLDAQIFI